MISRAENPDADARVRDADPAPGSSLAARCWGLLLLLARAGAREGCLSEARGTTPDGQGSGSGPAARRSCRDSGAASGKSWQFWRGGLPLHGDLVHPARLSRRRVTASRKGEVTSGVSSSRCLGGIHT
jgi:hypothetical protein